MLLDHSGRNASFLLPDTSSPQEEKHLLDERHAEIQSL